MKPKLDLHAILVPGLFSPPGAMLPIKTYLNTRLAKTSIWNHALAKDSLADDLTGLAGFLAICSAAPRPVAIIASGSGDWVSRQVLANLNGRLPSHFVSVSPVWKAGRIAAMMRQTLKVKDARVRLLGDPEQLDRHGDPPAQVRHLVLQSTFDSQLPSSPLIARPRYGWHCRVRGTRVSLMWQPNVWRRIDLFLRSQSVDACDDREMEFGRRPSAQPALNPAPMAKVG